MPEHVHLLMNEPQRSTLAQALKSLKQGVARRLALRAEEPFWQERYYDFNVWSERKFREKLRYLHRNPVRRDSRLQIALILGFLAHALHGIHDVALLRQKRIA